MPPRIAVDMDEVLADALAQHLALYNAEFGASFRPADLYGKKLYQVAPPEHSARIKAYAHQPGFFRDLAVLPDSQAVLQQLQTRYEVFIATAAMDYPNSFGEKYAWLREHFPFIAPANVVYCGDKSILAADYLIDDTARHFEGFRGQGLLFTAPHNAQLTGYRRVNHWREVAALFLGPPAAHWPSTG